MKSRSSTSDLIRVGERVSIRARGVRGIYIAEFWHSGQHRKQSLKTSNKAVALQRAIRLETDLMDGEYAPSAKPIGIAQAVAEYLEVKRGEGRKPMTLVKYKEWLESFAEFATSRGVHTLTQINVKFFEEFRHHRRQSRAPKTMYTGETIIKQLVKWCSGSGRAYLLRNPLSGCRLAQPPLTQQFTPTLDQVQAILARATGDQKLQLATLAMTGLRVQELQMLRLRDVDLKAGWIHVVGRPGWTPKTGNVRKIPIHPKLAELLTGVSGTARPYFFVAPPSQSHPDGNRPIDTKQLNVDLQRLAKALDIPTGRKNGGLVVHSLRHFFETQCVDSDVPQFQIDAWMGHASHSAMGRRYYGHSDLKSQEQIKRVKF